ncbi:hypothetical protein [Chitinophaga sp. MM2321]|uniref:hypothetical protein n=1 Tax=Chitinophaga sp. MM2321 TaxID=3137178 RepID=UPI0032D5A74C
MDWKDDIAANLWVFPRGMARNGEVGPQSLKWTSKYGSVVSSAWDIATVDGLNEKGLVANVLWLVESSYPKFDPSGTKKGIPPTTSPMKFLSGSPDFQFAVFSNLVKVRIGMYETQFIGNRILDNEAW